MTSFNQITLCLSLENSLQATEIPIRNGDGEKWSKSGYILNLELTEILKEQICSVCEIEWERERGRGGVREGGRKGERKEGRASHQG